MKITDIELKKIITEMIAEAKIIDFPDDALTSTQHSAHTDDDTDGDVIMHDFAKKDTVNSQSFYDILCQIKEFLVDIQTETSLTEDQDMKLDTLIQMVDDMADEEPENLTLDDDYDDDDLPNEETLASILDMEDENYKDIDDETEERLLTSMNKGRYIKPQFDDEED